MSFVTDTIQNVIGSVTGTKQAASAAQGAAATQAQSAQAGINEQQRQFDAMVQILSPFVQAGTGALGRLSPYETAGVGQLGTLGQFAGAGAGQLGTLGQFAGAGAGQLGTLGEYASAGATALEQQQALTGGLGPEAQASAIRSIEQSPQMQAMIQQGENAMLQNASATGGLRGGNLQAAMAQFRPQLLAGLIDQQYGRLGGLSTMGGQSAQNLASLGGQTSQNLASLGGQTAQNLASMGNTTTQNIAQLGQASAAGTGAAGLTSAKAISDLLTQQGQATAGGQIAYGSQAGQNFKSGAKLAGQIAGLF